MSYNQRTLSNSTAAESGGDGDMDVPVFTSIIINENDEHETTTSPNNKPQTPSIDLSAAEEYDQQMPLATDLLNSTSGGSSRFVFVENSESTSCSTTAGNSVFQPLHTATTTTTPINTLQQTTATTSTTSPSRRSSRRGSYFIMPNRTTTTTTTISRPPHCASIASHHDTSDFGDAADLDFDLNDLSYIQLKNIGEVAAMALLRHKIQRGSITSMDVPLVFRRNAAILKDVKNVALYHQHMKKNDQRRGVVSATTMMDSSALTRPSSKEAQEK